MGLNCEVVFQNMPEEKAIRRRAEREVELLQQRFSGIQRCQISFDVPYHHRYPGNIYEIKIEVTMRGHRISVHRSPSAEGSTSDVFALLHEAFREVEHKLEGSQGHATHSL